MYPVKLAKNESNVLTFCLFATYKHPHMVSIWHIIFRGLLCNVLLLFKKKCVSYKKLKTLRAQAHIFPKRLIGLIRVGVNGYFLAFNGWAPDAIYPLSQQALCPPPLQVDATYSANPDLSGKRERKKNHTHTRGKKKYLQDVLSVADKTHGVKTTCKWEVCRLLLFSSSRLFLLSIF